MIKFSCKGESGWRQCHLTHDWNMCALMALEDFIAKASAHKVFIVVLQTSQVTLTMNFPKTKPKTIFILVVIILHQAWPSYFLSMPCICKGM
jgi:hypothetical protein